jgi:two-component sensor histidine kinase
MSQAKRQLQFFALVYMGWWLLWAVIQFFILRYYGLTLTQSLRDAVLTQSVIMADGYVILTIVKYFRHTWKNSAYIIASSLMLAYLGWLGLNEVLPLFPADENYLAWLNNVKVIRFVFMALMVVITGVQGWILVYIREQQQNELRLKENERLVREAELSDLRQQLQPHFLFNSLNSISALAASDATLARKMIEQLSDFLRGTVKKNANQFVSLSEELQHLQLYLDIEKVRFGHRLVTKIVADDVALTMKLPSLLLQPLVENAIKFGLYDTIGEVVISLEAKASNGRLLIEIKNPFDAETSVPRTGTGFGLRSVQRRLSLLFFRNDLLSTQQKENVFITTIKIPQGNR